MLTIQEIANVLLVLAVLGVLALAGIGLWQVRQRRKAWEEYERARGAWMHGGQSEDRRP